MDTLTKVAKQAVQITMARPIALFLGAYDANVRGLTDLGFEKSEAMKIVDECIIETYKTIKKEK